MSALLPQLTIGASYKWIFSRRRFSEGPVLKIYKKQFILEKYIIQFQSDIAKKLIFFLWRKMRIVLSIFGESERHKRSHNALLTINRPT